MATVRWERDALGPLLDLPQGWRERIVAQTNHLRRFPQLGTPLQGRHAGSRKLIVGPYAVVYEYYANDDVVALKVVARAGLFG